MKSVGVLQKELELMDTIITFCKNKNLDFDDFEAKKDLLSIDIEVFNSIN